MSTTGKSAAISLGQTERSKRLTVDATNITNCSLKKAILKISRNTAIHVHLSDSDHEEQKAESRQQMMKKFANETESGK